MLARVALLLMWIPLLAHGVEGLYHAFRSRTPARTTCEQFRRERPSSGWLRMTGCEIDYVRAGYREARGQVTELFFPVRPGGSSPAQPSDLVIATRDPRLLALIERGLAGPARDDQEAFLVMMLEIVTAMGVSREIEGVLRSPLETRLTRRTLGALKAPLSEHFVVLDHQGRPGLWRPAIEAIVGAQALLLCALLSTSLRRSAGPSEPRTAAGPPPDPATALRASGPGATRNFRRLMLVNLPPHAQPSALETAPPLGTPADVRSALSRVLPGIAFGNEGVGRFNRPDHAITVDLGATPQVWTATVDVTGDAAPSALRRLVTQTGWQVYAPRLGRFLGADDLED